MKRFVIIVVMAALSGCAVTLHGNQTSGGGSTSTTTGSSVQGATRVGNARIGASFGSAPAPGTPGGQVSFSKGASAVLVLGVLIAGAADAVSDWFRPDASRSERAAGGSISQTCSCYGWQPDAAPAD